ncbi:MAG: hypothetical protein GY756_26905 [bacterium]|nr:hypothetical protein [bacterium]
MFTYDCISELISVRNGCEDQSSVTLFLDNEGISLANAANIADEKYINGKNLVDGKILQAVDDVLSLLTVNIYSDDDNICDIDTLVCENSGRIAKAVYYRAAALIYHELKFNTSRYNEFIKYSSDKVDKLLLMLDSEANEIVWRLGGGDGKPPSGKFQKEMLNLKPLQKRIEKSCTKECKGARHIYTMP